MAPKTSWGRILTIVYALIGIPLTFLYLSNIGNFLADCFRLFYKRVCCDVLCCEKCERKRKRLRLKQRRRREILAVAAQQRNFRFGEWNGETTTTTAAAAAGGLEPGRNPPRFVEVSESAAAADPLPINSPLGHQSSSSWTTVSTSSAATEGEGSPRGRAAASGGARETDILEDETTATSDDDKTTTDDGPTVRETDIIDNDNDDDDKDRRPPTSNAKTSPCRDAKKERQTPRRLRVRIPRSHSDTRLNVAAPTSTNRRVHIAADAAAADRDVMRRSASVKARATGSLVYSLLSLNPESAAKRDERCCCCSSSCWWTFENSLRLC